MPNHDTQQILDALTRVETQVHARIDTLDREMSEAITGLRDRHHDGMNIVQAQMARTSVEVASVVEQLRSHIRLTDTALAAISNALENHQREPGHPQMIRWQERVTGRAIGFAVGLTIGAGVTGSGLTLLIDRLLG